ncbi:MAG TPA: hypothetical protein VER76_22080, partial [Pyrinomonadaceae bacterium]|nr:hypothetical protein [Pyrinomonadaceae bacterium]
LSMRVGAAVDFAAGKTIRVPARRRLRREKFCPRKIIAPSCHISTPDLACVIERQNEKIACLKSVIRGNMLRLVQVVGESSRRVKPSQPVLPLQRAHTAHARQCLKSNRVATRKRTQKKPETRTT